MDGSLIGIIIGFILGKRDHSDCGPHPPAEPLPSMVDAWKTGWQRSKDNPSRLVRWLEALPGGRQWWADRRAHRG